MCSKGGCPSPFGSAPRGATTEDARTMLRLRYVSRPNFSRPLAAVGALAGALALTAGAAALTAEQPDRTARLDRSTEAAMKCGVKRWPVKTLADPDASHVSQRAVKRTVDALAHLPLAVGVAGARGVGTERLRVNVNAKLVEIFTEGDGDFHLVIQDLKTGMRMIAEFPNDTCTHGASKKLQAKMQSARDAAVTLCGFMPNRGRHSVKGEVTITGIPFFDFAHRQVDRAPNGIELHPVLRFTGHCTG
jgi:hypothetical protein